MNPITLFQNWFAEAVEASSASIPSACCLSTLGLDGYPNARFVSLKGIYQDQLIITGPMDARKGQELKKHPKASLSFWWPEVEKQVRIQGDVTPLPLEMAEALFGKRNLASKLVNTLFKQGDISESLEKMEQILAEKLAQVQNQEISKPEAWGGILIQPIRIELMAFQTSRLHHRNLYYIKDGIWHHTLLQP